MPAPAWYELHALRLESLRSLVPVDDLQCLILFEMYRINRDAVSFVNSLEEYWKHGKGAAKIRWGTPGDFTRCVRHLEKPDKPLGPERARRICAQWHHDMTGLWPGDKRNK